MNIKKPVKKVLNNNNICCDWMSEEERCNDCPLLFPRKTCADFDEVKKIFERYNYKITHE